MINGKEQAGIALLTATTGRKPLVKQNGFRVATATSMDEFSGHTQSSKA